MPQYKKTAITAKEGLNFVRNIVEQNGSLFHKIEQENDLGIDAILEFIDNGNPTNISIAVQIKSGSSYFNNDKTQCSIPVNSHYDYWMNYSLPVYGIVYDPESKTGNWTNIKEYIKNNKNPSRVTINRNLVNIFDNKSYLEVFSRLLTKKVPTIELNSAINLFLSDNYEESDLGLYTLFDNYRNEKVIWEEMIHFIKEKQIHRISNRLIYYLSHIPWHGDIFHYGEAINQENKEYVKKEIGDFSVNTVIKLLELIDENGISRGTIGQSIESILSLVNAKEEKLKNIINDNNLTEKVRLYAAGIYAYYSGMDAIPYLKKYSNIDGIHILLEQLFKYGELNFYG